MDLHGVIKTHQGPAVDFWMDRLHFPLAKDQISKLAMLYKAILWAVKHTERAY